jgi:hypothetical protein
VIFRDMFLLPPPEGVSCDGLSDEQPLFLHGVRRAAFRRLLMAMEQRKFPDDDDEYQEYDSETARIPFQEWVSVLEFSCMWQMAKVRKRAVEEILRLYYQVGREDLIYLLTLLDKLGIPNIRNRFIRSISQNVDPVELIRLGIELPVYSFILNGYAGLVVQDRGISTEHEDLLGAKTTSKLFRIRDQYLKNHPCFGRGDKRSVMSEVKRLFAEELEETIWK